MATKKPATKKRAAKRPHPAPKSDEVHYTGALLEELRSNLRLLAEGQTMFRESVDRQFAEFRAEFRADIGRIEVDVSLLKEDISLLKEATIENSHGIRDLKSAVERIEHSLTRKADVERVEALERRMVHLESAPR